MQPQPLVLTLDTSNCHQYAAPAVISLGEEYTDDTLPRHSSNSGSNSCSQISPISPDDEYDDQSPISPDAPSPIYRGPLWQEEHARLVNLHTTVLDNEREARDRELFLESHVARIKDDLARLKQARHRRNSAPSSPCSTSSIGNTSLSSSDGSFAKWTLTQGVEEDQFPPYSSTQSASQCLFATAAAAPPLPDEAALSSILTEAREARAEERQNRKRQRERIRELGVLLTLGSEVRKWEERLAWAASHSSSTAQPIEHDTDPDPRRSKRSSRSWSLPSSSYASASNNVNRTRSGPPSPALPSLASSPLWRVSAEMILRRGSLSERPRRQTSSSPTSVPTVSSSSSVYGLHQPALSTTTANAVDIVHATSGAITTTPAAYSSVVGGSSAKRYPVPPPITIPPLHSAYCDQVAPAAKTMPGPMRQQAHALPATTTTIAFSGTLSKSAPSRPSALKWAFTLDDLMREEELARSTAAVTAASTTISPAKGDEEDNKMDIDSDSSDDSESGGESAKSSSEGSDGNEDEGTAAAANKRRGRARFSWRKSLTTLQAIGLQAQLDAMEVDS